MQYIGGYHSSHTINHPSASPDTLTPEPVSFVCLFHYTDVWLQLQFLSGTAAIASRDNTYGIVSGATQAGQDTNLTQDGVSEDMDHMVLDVGQAAIATKHMGPWCKLSEPIHCHGKFVTNKYFVIDILMFSVVYSVGSSIPSIHLYNYHLILSQVLPEVPQDGEFFSVDNIFVIYVANLCSQNFFSPSVCTCTLYAHCQPLYTIVYCFGATFSLIRK